MENYCEPCGECRWCHDNFKARREVKALRRALAQALHQIDRLTKRLQMEAQQYEDVGSPDGPTREINTARRVARRLDPLTKARRSS